MGLFLAGCENKPAAPKTTTPAINPADVMKNMPKTPGTTDEKKTEAGATTDGKTDPAEPKEPSIDEPSGDAPESTEDTKDGEDK